MKFRRRTAPEPAAAKATEAETPADNPADDSTDNSADTPPGSSAAAVHAGGSGPPRATGPFDISEVDVDGGDRVDLGSLLIAPSPGREVRVQVDEATQAVQSVLVAGPDGALELRAFAAPRHGDLWSEVRPQLAADVEQRGGTVEEREGPFGVELVCQRPVQLPDGKSAVQPSRIVGVNGPRWLLRATFLGAPALRPEAAGPWEEVLGQVAVRRGEHAMPPGDALPVVLPQQAHRLP